MRTSDYVIFIKIQDEGKYLLIHGYTGAIDLVNKKIVSFLRSGNYNSFNISDIEILQKRGYLTEKTSKEEQTRVAELTHLFNKIYSKQQSFTIYISYDCNFRCAYCYEGSISKHGTAWSEEIFSKEKVDAVYEAIELLNTSELKGKQLTLYGGEPLLAKNKKIIDYFVEKGIEKGCMFSAITNGYEIDTYMDIIGTEGINYLQITLDGGEKTHNKRRPHFTGKGSYKKIVSNITKALEKNVRVSLRVNVDSENLPEIHEIIDQIYMSKWNEDTNFSCYLSPVQNAANLSSKKDIDVGSLLKSNCLPDRSVQMNSIIKRSEVLQYIEMCKKEDDRFHVLNAPNNSIKTRILQILKSKSGFKLQPSFCGATGSSLIFDPRGHIYKCWEFIGDTSYQIGSFFPKLIINEEYQKKWNNRTIMNLSPCNKCKYAFFCGGGCAAFAKRDSGSFWNSHCDEFPYLFLHSVKEAYMTFVNKRDDT